MGILEAGNGAELLTEILKLYRLEDVPAEKIFEMVSELFNLKTKKVSFLEKLYFKGAAEKLMNKYGVKKK